MSQDMNQLPPNWQQFLGMFGDSTGMSMTPSDANWSDPNWIEQYVQDMVRRSFRGFGMNTSSSSSAGAMPGNTFETHQQVVVKFHVPPNTNLRKVRLYLYTHKLVLEGPGSMNHTVRLPSPVDPMSGKAVYKDGVLQIQMRKRADTDEFHEIAIMR